MAPRALDWIVLAACLALALALRIPSLAIDPWIDEVWSWGLARGIQHPLDVFGLSSSNNHVLVTLWMRVVGDQDDFVLYRMPSLVAGLATVALAFWIARRESLAAAACAGLLFAVGFAFVAYSTEARGYAVQICASLGSFAAARAWLERRSRTALVLAWLAAALGWVAQLLFVQTVLALGIWCAVRVLRRRTRFVDAALLLGPIAALFAGLYVVHVRHVVNAGSPPWDVFDVARRTFEYGLGLHGGATAIVIGCAIVAAALALDTRTLARAGRDEWLFFAVAIVLVPLATAFLLRGEYVATRYFLGPLTFVTLALARVLGRAFDAGGGRRLGACIVIAALLAGHAVHLAGFARLGKGRPSSFIATMAERTPRAEISMAGSHDFNVGAVLEYFRRGLPPGRSLRYSSGQAIPKAGVDWLVINEPDIDAQPRAELSVGSLRFTLVDAFKSYGPFGVSWDLYQRR